MQTSWTDEDGIEHCDCIYTYDTSVYGWFIYNAEDHTCDLDCTREPHQKKVPVYVSGVW
jgi:hypothetical protein